MSQSTSSMEANNIVEVACPDPDYITFIDPKQEYNCYFVVGNETLQNIEKIGVVKKMLLAHSVVLRTQLQDSKIAEKDDVLVPDIFPDTFKNLLRYVYGHDNTAALSFDEADNLLYAAEKYMLTKLKNKLATCLMSMLDYTNICSLMNNPVCYTVLELNSAITEILQLETDKVLASPQFMNLCPDGFLKILEQETSSVAEIELWRSALKWAKNRTNSEDGQILRNELSCHIQHIRVCSLTAEDFCSEVIPTGVLSYDEVKLVCQSRRSKEMQPQLTTVCNVLEERSSPLITSEVFKVNVIQEPLNSHGYGYCNDAEVILTTFDEGIELFTVDISTRGKSDAHQLSGSLTITKDSDTPVVVSFSGELDSSSSSLCIPVILNGKNVQLLPNSSYKISVQFSCDENVRYAFFDNSNGGKVVGKHFSVDLYRKLHGDTSYYLSHISNISYRTKTRKRNTELTHALASTPFGLPAN